MVTAKDTGALVPKTLITVQYSDMPFINTCVYTDENGYYRVESMGAGEYIIHVDAEPWGYVRTRKTFSIGTGDSMRSDFALSSAVTISGRFVDEKGESVEISPKAWGTANTFSYDVSGNGASWTGTMNKYAVKGLDEDDSNNTFEGGNGDYTNEYMVFPTADTFIIQGVLPGKITLSFRTKEEDKTVKKILHKGKDITGAMLDTSSGQSMEDIRIVIGSPDQGTAGSDDVATKNYMLAYIDMEYEPLFEKLELSSDVCEKVKNLMVESQMGYGEINKKGSNADSDAERDSLRKRYEETLEQADVELAALLGDQDYQAFVEYRGQSTSRFYVRGFRALLDADEAINDDLANELIGIMYQKQQEVFAEIGVNPEKTIIFQSEVNSGKFASQSENMKKIHSRTIDVVQDILTEVQLEKLEAFLTEQREAQEKVEEVLKEL